MLASSEITLAPRAARYRTEAAKRDARKPEGPTGSRRATGRKLMDERQRRDFQAGLAAEVDAWLRGEPTRRDFIKRFGQAAGMLALSGAVLPSFVNEALAQAQMQLEDPVTPLGKAQALALAASTEGPADGSAFRAVEAAKQFSGVNLNMTYEAGLQALDPRNFSGPLWEQLTGIKSTVVELPVAGHVFEADRRAHRRLRRLRRPRPAAAVDAVAGRRRGDRAARRLHRQVHEHGGSRRLPSALQGPADLQGQDLGLLRRRRHVRPLLSQGHLRGPEAERGLPGEVRQGARSAEDLGGLRAGRAVHHRPDGAECLRRRALPQGRLARQPVRLHAAVPLQRRRLLRRQHEGARSPAMPA